MRREELRGLPCSIASDERLWCIVGKDGEGGGVLEWCYDQRDAESELRRLLRDETGRYRGLKAVREGYPDSLLATVLVRLRGAAIDWIDANLPAAWYRSMFE